jgi:hypothetical protein
MRRPRIFRILGEQPIDLRPDGLSLPLLRERHAMVSRKPPIIAIARRKPVEQFQQRAFLPSPARATDQDVGERGGAEHNHVARPGVQGIGRRHRRACRRRVPALQQGVRLGGMGEGKGRDLRRCTIERRRSRRGTWSGSRHNPRHSRPAVEDVVDNSSPYRSVNMVPHHGIRFETTRSPLAPAEGKGSISA